MTAQTVAPSVYTRDFRLRIPDQKKKHRRSNAAQRKQPLHVLPRAVTRRIESNTLNRQKLWQKLDERRPEIR